MRIYYAVVMTIALSFAAAAVIAHPSSANAGQCWEEASYSKWKVGCEVIRKLANGKYLLLCCN